MTTNITDLKLDAGQLCLDFANTVDWHASARPVEYLNRYEDIVLWAQNAALINNLEGGQLRQQAAAHPSKAVAALTKAVELREIIYRIFSAIAVGRSPAAADIASLNELLPEALMRLQIVETEAGFRWRWLGRTTELEGILWPIIRSAAGLLTEGELDRVKECEDDRGCGFLFFDTSRNRSRRWCSMESCGNRAKVRRHRRKQRS